MLSDCLATGTTFICSILLTLRHIDISRLQSTSAGIRPSSTQLMPAGNVTFGLIWFQSYKNDLLLARKSLETKEYIIGFYSEGIRRLQNYH